MNIASRNWEIALTFANVVYRKMEYRGIGMVHVFFTGDRGNLPPTYS